MAKAKYIRVSYMRTINTGNYENVKLEAELELELELEDNVEEEYKKAYNTVAKEVNVRAKFIKEQLEGK